MRGFGKDGSKIIIIIIINIRYFFAEKSSSAVSPGRAVDPSLPKTRTSAGIILIFLPQARAYVPFAWDFGMAGPTALFAQKTSGAVDPGSFAWAFGKAAP